MRKTSRTGARLHRPTRAIATDYEEFAPIVAHFPGSGRDPSHPLDMLTLVTFQR